jgi:hypothetical protein
MKVESMMRNAVDTVYYDPLILGQQLSAGSVSWHISYQFRWREASF